MTCIPFCQLLLFASTWTVGAPAPSTDEPAEPGVTPLSPAGPQPAPKPERFNRWSIEIQPGGEFIFGGQWNAYGPAFRLGGWVHSWRGKFLVGGGPTVHYTYLVDNTPEDDELHFFTVNGDLLLGGGNPDKIAGFGHLTLGAGMIYGKDGGTGTRILVPGIRAGIGGGLYGFVHPKVSLGALVDFGYLGGLGVDALLTVGIHFQKKPK